MQLAETSRTRTVLATWCFLQHSFFLTPSTTRASVAVAIKLHQQLQQDSHPFGCQNASMVKVMSRNDILDVTCGNVTTVVV